MIKARLLTDPAFENIILQIFGLGKIALAVKNLDHPESAELAVNRIIQAIRINISCGVGVAKAVFYCDGFHHGRSKRQKGVLIISGGIVLKAPNGSNTIIDTSQKISGFSCIKVKLDGFIIVMDYIIQ